jgi:hypothetical protein
MLKPNDLMTEQVDTLQDWELLVSVFHFAPTRKDCVEIGYGYEYGSNWGEDFSDGRTRKLHTAIWCCLSNGEKISLRGEVDLDRARDIVRDEYRKREQSEFLSADGWKYRKEITIYPLMADWKEFARHKLKEIIKERVAEQEEVESGV